MVMGGGATSPIRLVARHANLPCAHNHNPLAKLRIGSMYCAGGQDSDRIIVVDILYAFPLIVARDMTIDRLAIDVQILAAGAGARLGIYNDEDCAPSTLLIDAGIVSVAAAAPAEVVINQQLRKGIYWVALVSDGAPTLSCINENALSHNLLGLNAGDFGYYYTGYSIAHAYGALPDPFGAGALYLEDMIKIAVRIASLD